VSESAQKRVTFVQRVDRSLRFTDGKSCDAFVTSGMVYEGVDLKMSRPFCEVSLKWRKDDLETSIRNQTSFSECQSLAKDIVSKIYELSAAICKQLEL
jgi:hypothetical protein